MNDNFKTHLLNEQGIAKARQLSEHFDRLLDECKSLGVSDRYLALVATKLEEACFFAKKSIAVKPENQQ